MKPEPLKAPDVPPAVARRAINWIMDLQNSDNPETTAVALKAWCASHPDHQRAWDHIEKLNQHFGLLNAPGQAEIAQRALTASGLSRRSALKTLSLLLVVAGSGYAARDSGVINRWRADYFTAIGEQQSITLANGNKITLNSGTAIQVDEQPATPAVHLLQGEIHIAMDQRLGSSLSVEVKQGSVRPLNASFALRQMGAQCRLAVYQGQVEIQPRHAVKPCLLQAGEATLFTQADWTPFSQVPPDEAAWIEGIIVVHAMPLKDFIEELSRYRPGILRVDPSIAHLTVSGTYPVTQTDKVLQSLTAALPIQQRKMTSYWVTLVPA